MAAPALGSPQPSGKPSLIGDPDTAEEEGKSALGKWKWVLLVAGIIVVVYVLTQLTSFDCSLFNSPLGVGGGNPTC